MPMPSGFVVKSGLNKSRFLRNRDQNAVAFACFGFHAEQPRLVVGRHRVDGVRDQVQEQLPELNLISLYLRELPVRLGLNKNLVLLQVAMNQGTRLLDEFADVERRSVAQVVLEDRANACDHGRRALAIH